MGISKVTRNFQVTLPSDIRDATGIREGDRILFTTEDGKVELRKLDEDIIARTAGLWKGMEETGVAYTRRLRKEWDRRS